MAYITGSVNGLNALFGVADAFIAGAPSATCAGWTKAETVAAQDVIYKSNGTDGKVDMVYRFFASTAASNPFKVNYNPHVKFPWLMVLGYSAWTVGAPGTGIKMYGQVGPVMMGNRPNGGTPVADAMTMHRYNSPVFPISTPATMNEVFVDGRTRKSKQNESYEGTALCFDGRRKFYGCNTLTQTQICWQDLVHGETNTSSGGILATSNQHNMILVHDAVNDKDVVYILNATATLAQQFVKFDMETKTFTTLAPPTWSVGSTTGAAMCWDGGDFIYAVHGNNTTDFARYSISGNSWTNLAAAPVARSSVFAPGSTGCQTNMVYIPNSVSGIGEDVIYVPLAASGTVIYRYDVTANAWRSTAGTGALTSQVTIAASFFLAFDGTDKLIHGTPNVVATHWFQSSFPTPNVWTNIGNPQSTNRNYNGLHIVNHIPAKVRSHATLDTQYWMLGNRDFVIIVTKVQTPTPHYYSMYLGRFNSSNRTTIMTTTAPVVSGGRVSIPVDDSSAYSVGERVMLWDPTTATSEVQNIYSVPDATHVVVNLSNNYGTGTRIGLDPTQWGCGGNGVFMVPTDAWGYNTDNEPCQMIMEPTIPPEATDRSSPGSWKLFQPNPFTLFNPDRDSSKYGNRGFLQSCGALSNGVYPRPQSEDPIKINKKTHIFFADTETGSYTKDIRGIVIGPID